jgi:hypothetical protein
MINKNKFAVKKIPLENLSEYQIEQCKLFSEYSFSTSITKYSERNQSDIEKIKSDIFLGKTAEFMVYNYLNKNDKNPTSPDLNIYSAKKKSFDADIFVKNTKIHVKSHKINKYFPVSWIFQKSDPLIIHKDSNNYLALVVLDDINYMYILNIMDVIFEEPLKESLKNNKICIYEKNLT